MHSACDTTRGEGTGVVDGVASELLHVPEDEAHVESGSDVREPARDGTDGTVAQKTPWRLLTGLLAEQKRGLIAGVLVGLAWAAAKVSVPSLIRNAIDRGIKGNEPLL